MKRLCLLLALVSLLAACDKKKEVDAPKAVAQQPQEAEKPTEKAEEKLGAAADQKPHTSGLPATLNQALVDQEIPGIDFKVTSPEDGETIQGGSVNVAFDLKNYRVGKEIGQHIHVILDNEPYHAHYDASEPLKLDVSEGTHVIRAFPARHYHLAVKKGDLIRTVVFNVGKATEGFSFDKSKPYLTYSRPKGKYSAADAKEGLLLDYYVSNIEIGDNAKVVYGVDGKETTQTKWEPVILPPLEAGEHTITLKLVDKDGKLIQNGGFNNTTRKITVE